MSAAGSPVKSLAGAAVPAPGKRPYASPVREDQARVTRRTVVAAATRLFLAHGYAATTMQAVAREAGVSRKTVFAAGGKYALLKDAYDWALVGDDQPVAMADREPVQRILATSDQLESVRLWAELITRTAQRVAPIGAVLLAAAEVDPQAAELLRTEDRARHDGARAFVGHLAAHGGLRPGLTVSEATDLCWLANDARTYIRLVVERGWTPERFRDRLCALVSWELLGR